jgi:acyl carrier protein
MDQNAFIVLLQETLELAPGSLSLSDSLEDHGWDSLAILGFISAVDSELDVTLDAAKLADATTPADLLALVNEAAA